MLELLFWAWAIVAILAFVWSGPWVITGVADGNVEPVGLLIWPVGCALVPFLIVFGFLLLGWEKITGKKE
ncbi:hypothetical protein PP459_gp111 [Streptomyces phage Wakanda]|uniref:Uncharacterized protein n=2 Tax=Wakandavirus TaxID=3044854 RepID=A0A6G8R3A9_9CAUD|nr:hypothetical protein PP459_gp111 [Streptomyces phage Wakanda]YP_010652443.1 hypothetical protein PP460_gp115 [Streptomyces phage Muntaha]QIN94122.1 hypothetical protein SEA_WAKANDA_160 [Streptomyces phage Wakanda]QIN94687.1 hypothetical protein SEA_MUNTAHA_162 [Streptomyces phage Muntaha]